MNITDLEEKLKKFSDNLGELTENNHLYKEISEIKKEIYDLFNIIEFENPEQRQESWNNFQSLNDFYKGKQQIILNANKKYAEDAIAIFERNEPVIAGILEKGLANKDDFGVLKVHLNEVFEAINQNRWPSRDERNVYWDKFNTLRNEARKKEDEFFNKLRDDIKQKAISSKEITEKILPLIEACLPGQPLELLKNSRDGLKEYCSPLEMSAEDAELFELEIDVTSKQTLRLKSESLRGVRKIINSQAECLTREDRGLIFDVLTRVSKQLDESWKNYKQEQQKKQDEWKDRKTELDEKKSDWERKQREFLSMLEGRVQSQNIFIEKLHQIAEDQHQFIARLETRIENQQEFLIKLNDQLIDLEDQHDTAWTIAFKDKVSGWIVNKKAKISEVEKDILSTHKKVAESQKKIDAMPAKIQEVEASIVEITEKIVEVKGKLQKVFNHHPAPVAMEEKPSVG